MSIDKIVRATVAEGGMDRVVLDVNQQRIPAETRVPLYAGQRLNLLVVAAGKGMIAEKIIETARRAGVYIKEDPDLLELLAQVPVGEMIPMELYQIVTEILAFVYRINERYKQQAAP